MVTHRYVRDLKGHAVVLFVSPLCEERRCSVYLTVGNPHTIALGLLSFQSRGLCELSA